MVYENPTRVEARIKRLSKEIDEIDDFFYGPVGRRDRLGYMGMLERKRDDIVRSIVLQLHTAIEELMTEGLFDWVLGTKHMKSSRKRRTTRRGQALGRMVGRLGFDAKLDFAVVTELFRPKLVERLRELNRVRNKCAHHWILDAPNRPRSKVKGKRPRLLTWGGRDLHNVKVLKEFIRDFGHVYFLIFGIVTQRDRGR